MLIGQSGILKQARNAKNETIKGEIINYVQQDIQEQMIENGGRDITKEQLYDILKEHFGEEQVPRVYNEDGTENEKWVDFPENFPKLKKRRSRSKCRRYI